ncbi:pectinesterase inhibitor 10-like [Sipha flava]|uniref:Pectinesterase inhibitor 10-like n=1 Tax=Sipha flava TaxID=143950 RepID=A0A8B8F463_9HEMI|nr:pectinesterase inhibitor 10-like [Sipha flava]
MSVRGLRYQILPPPANGGINEPQDCPYCRRTFSCYYSLKRHFQDKHERSDTLYVCEFCRRRYRTKNSLTTHKSLQHRATAVALKRPAKPTAAAAASDPSSPARHHTRPPLPPHPKPFSSSSPSSSSSSSSSPSSSPSSSSPSPSPSPSTTPPPAPPPPSPLSGAAADFSGYRSSLPAIATRYA